MLKYIKLNIREILTKKEIDEKILIAKIGFTDAGYRKMFKMGSIKVVTLLKISANNNQYYLT